MIVTLISQCEKKAIARTRRILDTFANRIGDAVWQTIITEDGLNSLRMQLRQTATKNTAVACHWVRSKKRTELLWIVGNREKFNEQGLVPVNSTAKSVLHSDWENNWRYLPAIKALTAFSSLLHDLGKASNSFQSKLKQNKNIADPYRHEWISVLLFHQWLIKLNSKESLPLDSDWLKAIDELKNFDQLLEDVKLKNFRIDFSKLPPIALLICWLMLSHHRLPNLSEERLYQVGRTKAENLTELMTKVSAQWGYQHDAPTKSISETIKLSLLKSSTIWQKQLKKWAKRLADNIDLINEALDNGAWRPMVLYSHLCLTLADHYFSSLDKIPFKESHCSLYANTEKNQLKQHLDDHLIGVCKQALNVAHYLPQFSSKMESAHDIKLLSKRSPEKYRWQDKAVTAIQDFRKTLTTQNSDDGYFVVNMASTGQGKTIANAKIMRALSPDQDSLRYVLALGLRTLTLQTGSSYREDIHLQTDDLAVVIGSETINTLYEKSKNSESKTFSESSEALISHDIGYSPTSEYEFLDVLFHKKEEKLKAFLFKPVLCCTIDHMMPATEAVRGGRFILPMLRLMASDLIIDEIDDFSPSDLVAIARLTHLAGMLGRKVMLSSATIPPDLAAGLFQAYENGRKLYCNFMGLSSPQTYCMWVDEFKSEINRITCNDKALTEFQSLHQAFVHKRCRQLQSNIVKQLGYLIPYDPTVEPDNKDQKLQSYFEKVRLQIYWLHHSHSIIDEASGKKISFGLIRMANVKPCIQLSRYLLQCDDPNFEVKVLTYHSRELLLVRSAKEQYLDTVLRRKDSNPFHTLSNPLVRQQIEHCSKSNIIFVVVSTPVEEVGRDHDFDWAIIEPSSMRSIIQLAGRVRRHRVQTKNIDKPNVGVLQFNLRAIFGKNPAFIRPGFENTKEGVCLETKDMAQLVNWNQGRAPINAIARISKSTDLHPSERLADLEHAVIAHKLVSDEQDGVLSLYGWLNETWFLTGLAQQVNPFRGKNADIPVFLRFNEEGKLQFHFKDDSNDFLPCERKYNIVLEELTPLEKSHLWFHSDLKTELKHLLQSGWKDCETIEDVLNRSPELGEVLLIPNEQTKFSNIYIESLGLMCGVKIDHD